MRHGTIAAAAALLVLGGCSQLRGILGDAADAASNVGARADIIDAQQRDVGDATFESTPSGMLIRLSLDGDLTVGTHGVHIHQVGRCDAPSFETAGGHLNPAGRQHGFRNTAGPHAGDLPNIDVVAGATEHELIAREVTLTEGAAALLDADGSAIVIHASADDYRSDPSGNSGARIACGIIRR